MTTRSRASRCPPSPLPISLSTWCRRCKSTEPMKLRIICIFALVLLNACATGNPAFQEAQAMRAQGRIEESLAKFGQARQLDPNNAQIRMAYETYREQVITQFLNDANDALLKSNYAQATMIYQRILATDPGNRRALDGLRRVQRAPVDGQLLHAAENALAAKDDEGARQQLRMILAEEPDHARARELLG